MTFQYKFKQIQENLGPILLSALSLFLSFKIIQPLALSLNPIFHLLSSRGIGKIAFTIMVIWQIILLFSCLPKKFLEKFLNIIFFFKEKSWFSKLALYFAVFFSAYMIFQIFFLHLGYIQYDPNWGIINITLLFQIVFGIFITFFLAWTEEAIFRGAIYTYLNQFWNIYTSILATSLIFMFAHDLSNPLNLITKNWRLGLGLFLLGFLLNQIFVISGKLYTAMGAHMGLVAVKVFFRKAPFLTFVITKNLPYWLHSDLRQSPIIHLAFVIIIMITAINSYFNPSRQH